MTLGGLWCQKLYRAATFVTAGYFYVLSSVFTACLSQFPQKPLQTQQQMNWSSGNYYISGQQQHCSAFMVERRGQGEVEGHLVKNHPVGVDLGIALWVQDDRLIGSEVCQSDLSTLWTHVNQIHHCIIIKVILTDVSNTVHWERDRQTEIKTVRETGRQRDRQSERKEKKDRQSD